MQRLPINSCNLLEVSNLPGWAGNHIGFYPFPMSIADENA
jgi:hypothetical protein